MVPGVPGKQSLRREHGGGDWVPGPDDNLSHIGWAIQAVAGEFIVYL